MRSCIFNPCPKELVEEFFGHKEQAASMLECLAAIGEGNIRIVSRVGSALSEIDQLFSDRDAPLSPEDKNEIVKLCVFYFRAGRAITAGWFESHWKTLFETDEAGERKKKHDPAHELLKKLGASWSDFGPLVVQWLNFGMVECPTLEAAVIMVQNKQWRETYQRRSAEAYAPFNANFVEADSDKVTAPIIRLLDDYAEKLSKDGLSQHFSALRDFSISPDPWILKHVQSWIPKMDFNLCHEYLSWLPDGEAKHLVQAHLGTLTTERHPKEIVWRAVRTSGWSRGDMEFLASVSVEQYKRWLEQENDPDALPVLREFMGYYSLNGTEPKDEACRRISEAIELMANENRVHRVRASVFGLLKAAASKPLESPSDGK